MRRHDRASRRSVVVALVAGLAGAALAGATTTSHRFITIASTTSTENSGLFGHLLPQFTADHGIEVRVVAVGTGQAIKLAERGDADVLLVHHLPSEERFVAEGFGVERFDVMHNDFVLIGPTADPAGIKGLSDAAVAMKMIAAKGALFASRGDDSGTHKLEQSLWEAAHVDVTAASGGWYRETGASMGATLNIASGLGAYALADRGTWVSFANKGELAILVEGDRRLFNQYGVILVNPATHPHVKATEGQAFIDWLTSERGQNAIRSFRFKGTPLFFPNANRTGN